MYRACDTFQHERTSLADKRQQSIQLMPLKAQTAWEGVATLQLQVCGTSMHACTSRSQQTWRTSLHVAYHGSHVVSSLTCNVVGALRCTTDHTTSQG